MFKATGAEITWAEFKTIVNSRGLRIQHIDTGNTYHIFAADYYFRVYCRIYKFDDNQTVDKEDFEENYKSNTNQPLEQLDSDGASIVRTKAAKKGWTYNAIPIEIKTSTLAAVDTPIYAKMIDGSDRSGMVYKIYNNSDIEITTPGALNANLGTAVKTVVSFEPSFDYEVIGGNIRIENDLTQDMRLYIIAVPDVPANLGGSKEMCGGINLRYLAPQNMWEVDGRVTKLLKYDAIYHTNKLQFVFKHPAGLSHKIILTLEYYRE